MTLINCKKTSIALILLSSTCLTMPAHASFQEFDNALLCSVTPATPSLFQDVVRDTKTQTFDRLKESTVTAYRLAKNVYQGDFSEIAGTSIHLMLAKLAGRTNVALFDVNPDFDRRSLQVCSESLTHTLMQSLMNSLNKDSTRYGRVRGTDQHVDIFNNRTFLQMLADKVLPESTPLRGVFMGIANNPMVDSFVRSQITRMSLGFVEGLAQNAGMTLREAAGELVVMPFSTKSVVDSSISVVEEEQTPFYANSFWETLKPYILHEMRNTARYFLDKSLTFTINQMDQILRNGALGLSVAGGATLGGAAMTLGAGIPYLGGLFSLFGAGTTLGSLGGGTVGGFAGSSFLDAVGKNTAKRMDAFSDVVVSKIIEYTPEEHALYGLNPNASQIERDLFPQDYARRDALTNARTHTVVEIIRALSSARLGDAFSVLCSGLDEEARGAANALWSLFSTTPDLSAGTAMEQSGLSQYVDHAARAHKENRSKAYRHFILQSESNPELARTVRQYPGYDMRMAQIKGFMATPSEESRQLSMKTKYAVKSLEYISWDLTAELGLKMSDTRIHDILLNLSVSEQDLLVEMKESGWLSPAYESLLERLDHLTKKTFVDEEVVALLKESIAQEAARKNEVYARTHAEEIDQLRHLSLAHGLIESDLIDLHKALSVAPEKMSSVLQAPKAPLPLDSLEVMKRYYEESLANQRGMKMYSLLADSLAAQGVLAKVKKATFERVISSSEPVALDQIRIHVSDVMTDTSEFKGAMDAVRPIRDENAGSEFQKRLKSVFDARRMGLMQTLAEEVEQEVQEHLARQVPFSSEVTEEVASQMTASWMPSLWRKAEPTVSSSQPAQIKVRPEDDFEIMGTPKEPLTQNSVIEALAQDQRKLINYDSTAFGASRLLNLINEEIPGVRTTEAFEALMEKIMMEKRESLSSDEDRVFFDTHKQEINAFISGPDSPVKGRLWYSLQTVIDAFRAKNEIFLRSVLANQ